jgi:hypothetical protein
VPSSPSLLRQTLRFARLRLRPLLLLLALTLSACDRDAPVDLAGKRVDPLASRARATVLLFVSTTCPISNRYAPELRRIYDRYRPAGVEFYLVYVDRHDAKTDIERHTNEYQLPIPALRDPGHRLVKWARATTTPEAALFAHGALVYHGRIDDRSLDFGREQPEAQSHDLVDAIEEALNDRPPARPESPPVGCAIAPP